MPKRSRRSDSADDPDARHFEQYLKSSPLDVARRYGDWDYLAVYIEDGGIISGEMRGFLAEILRGKIKRPNNRPGKLLTRAKSFLIAKFVLEQEGAGKRTEKAIADAVERFEVDRRTVQRALKTWRPHLPLQTSDEASTYQVVLSDNY
jgi:hypothetical protein